MPKPSSVLELCQKCLPDVTFQAAKSFYWSPRALTIHFDKSTLDTSSGTLALLHEFSHAFLGHTSYTLDAELVSLETAAWHLAAQKAQEWSVAADLHHIEDCLDTYREWLYARSTCPTCQVNSLQISRSSYKCINCRTTWSVSPSRFCRPYRMLLRTKTPSQRTETVFN